MLVSAKKWRRSNHFTFLPHLNAGPTRAARCEKMASNNNPDNNNPDNNDLCINNLWHQ
jgi:hypothetical protein